MNPHDVPGYEIVEEKIKEIDENIVINNVIYDSSKMRYIFRLINHNGRSCEVIFSREFLDDLNDYADSKTTSYWSNMEKSLLSALLGPMEKRGLVPFTKEKLKELIFEHVKKHLQTTQHINKYNMLGRPYQEGSLENFIGVKFTEKERAAAAIAFDELRSQGILIPTYKDLINPEDWVKIGDVQKTPEGKVLETGAVKKEEDVQIGDLGKVGKIPIESVFLSSTVENLRDCRAEVVDELDSKGIKTIYSESPDFAGIPRNNVYDICLQNVLSSSHFIIILDRKYGELYQGTRYERFKDVSITHAELKVALEDKKKPILFYVRDYVWHHYTTWKNNPKLKCNIETGVFEIIKEFDAKKQYITSFDTSVKLKKMILRRLGIS
ncbi:MAG: DUF4062 domain-containing protein [Candidatus Omnitrophica bacterium]|nr:DUF4062 domain-containing protein [Candidatus Omnitrophota bacterium]